MTKHAKNSNHLQAVDLPKTMAVEIPLPLLGAFAKLYSAKTAITAADLLNDHALLFFEANGGCMLRILTDRGTEYCGCLGMSQNGLIF